MLWLSKHLVFIVASIITITPLSHQADEPSTQVAPTEVSDAFLFNLKGAEPNELYEILATLSASTNYTIHVSNIPANLGFIIVQAHGYLHEIALAYSSNYTRNNFVIKGTNVGLVESKTAAASFELSNPNPANVSVMINIIGYSKTTFYIGIDTPFAYSKTLQELHSAPIPGGCNMVFNVEIAPYLELSYNDSIIEVTSQPAMSTTYNSNCNRNSLSYEIYHMYQLERDFSQESYFKNLKVMMTVDGIRAHGRKVHPPLLGTNQKKLYSAYPGTGSVYAVIVSETQLGVTKSAAYVPIQTYACNPLKGSCDVLNTTLTKTVAVTIFGFGLLLSHHGHVSSNWETFLISSLWSGISVAYHSRDAVNVVRPLVVGLVFGLIWLMIWSCCCTTYLSRISTYATCGAVITALTIFRSGVGDFPIMENDTNFWLVFITYTLFAVVLLHVGHHKTSILACSVVGAYITIIPIDHFIGSHLKYAFINVMRRAVVENFSLATVDPPFQFRDIIMVLLFCLLTITGFVYQFRKFKKRPDYQSNAFPHNFQYFEPSFNETTPVLDHEELPGYLAGWLATSRDSPGSDSIFAPSAHLPYTLGYPHPPPLPHPPQSSGFTGAANRFMHVVLRGNPNNANVNLSGAANVPRYPCQTSTPQQRPQPIGMPPETNVAHPSVPEYSHIHPGDVSPIPQRVREAQGEHVQGQSKGQAQGQGQGSSDVMYPRVPKGNSDSENESPPPTYESIR